MVQTYNYDFSPEDSNYYGEGGLDTSVIMGGSEKVSLQRTGYFELVNDAGGRKVVAVNDGESVTDEVEVPSPSGVPTGNPLVV